MSNRTNEIEEILTRGVERIIDQKHLREMLFSGQKLRVKFGIDPTGSKIHLGNAIPLWKLRALQDIGHQVILIIGDFTAQIGDTSDKKAIRQPLTLEQVKENMKDYQKQVSKILDLSRVEFVYNSQWLGKMTFDQIIHLASNFTVAQMIERENFSQRYQEGKPIGLQEFLYPLMQGYDSVAVKSDLEVGGNDQTFNMLAGRIIQRAYRQEPQDVMTMSLIEGLDGRKMSKSYGNTVNIDDSPMEMFGKIMSMKDELMIKYFTLCTQASLDEIQEIEEDLQKGKVNPRDIKDKLAQEIVSLYWSPVEAEKASREFKKVFQEKRVPQEIPEVKVDGSEIDLVSFLAENNLVKSKSEARRLIEQKGVKINQQVWADWSKKLPVGDGVIIQVGKRKFIKIRKNQN